MSDDPRLPDISHWIPWIATGLGLLLVMLASWTMVAQKSYQAAQSEHLNRDSAYTARDAQYVECLKLPTIDDVRKCAASADQPGRSEERAEEDLRAQEEMADWAESMVWISLAGLAATSVGIVYVALTLRETRLATAAAIRGTKVSEEAVSVQRELGEKQVRAYIFLDAAGPILPFQLAVGEPPSGMINIKNFGQSPAYDIRCQRGTMSGPWPIPDDFEFPTDDTANFATGASLAPGEVTSFPIFKAGQIVGQEDFDGIRDGNLAFYIWGRIRYRDVFGHSRHTNFCLTLDPQSVSQHHALRRSGRHNDVS